MRYSTTMRVKQFAPATRITCALIFLALCGARTAVPAQAVSPVSLVTINFAGTSGGNDLSGFPAVSADGRYVLFSSDATDLVANYTRYMDLYVRDLQTGTTTPVNVNRNGTSGLNGPTGAADLSPSGRYVAFESVATDLVNRVDTNNTNDVFLRDLQTGVTTLVSVNRFGTATGNDAAYWPKVSADGRFVVFTSYATDLVENYRAGEQGLFVRDMVAGTTTLIVSGVPDSTIIINGKNLSGSEPKTDRPEVQDYHPILSANGRILAFSCYSDLVFPPSNG